MRIYAELQSSALGESPLAKLASAMDPGPILDEAQAIILNRIRTRFLAEEGPDGKWEPSQAGLTRKAGGYTYRNGKKYTATGTLFETGTLFHSIQAVASAHNERTFSTDVPYSRYHQYGKGDMFRPFLGFNSDDISVVRALFKRRIAEALA